jgi:TonB family protein
MFRSIRYAAILVMLVSASGIMNAEMRVTTSDALKAVTKKTAPDYPAVARQMKIAGKVEVEIVIDEKGNVESVKVVSGNALLTSSVVTAVKNWKFEPFLQGGTPAKAVAALDFDFKF